MIDIKNNSDGQIQIADEVIAIIAGAAAVEVEGVYGTAGSDIAGIFGQKNLTKGVKLETDDNKIKVDISISAKFGYKLPEVSIEVQKRVKQAIETMTAIEVAEVNVNIVSVLTAKEKKVTNDLVYNAPDKNNSQ